jgi:hypothetical protein
LSHLDQDRSFASPLVILYAAKSGPTHLKSRGELRLLRAIEFGKKTSGRRQIPFGGGRISKPKIYFQLITSRSQHPYQAGWTGRHLIYFGGQ